MWTVKIKSNSIPIFKLYFSSKEEAEVCSVDILFMTSLYHKSNPDSAHITTEIIDGEWYQKVAPNSKSTVTTFTYN